jgi:hypothetical protein
MAQDSSIIRQEHLQELNRLAARLNGRIRESGGDADPLRAAIRATFSAECVQCGLQVSAAEFLTMVETDDSSTLRPKLERLRQGYCGRQGCNSYYYRFVLQTHSALNWMSLFQDSAAEPDPVPEPEDSMQRLPDPRAGWLRASRRSAMIVGAIGLVLFARHWQRGGTIPWIREPEHFEVDVIVPDGPSER